MNLEPWTLGVDEAGRGPVLGAMVYASAYCPSARLDELANKKFADSKTLTPAKRADLLAVIQALPWLRTRCVSLTARELSAAMVSERPVSLNTLAHDTTIGLIQFALDEGLFLEKVFIDTVGDPDRYRAKLEIVFSSYGIQFTVTSKADALFPIVSAASIMAKTTRDREIAGFVFEEKGLEANTEFGSGYPGDPATKRWLVQHVDPVFGFPSLVRFGWATTKTLMQERCVPVTWYDAVDEKFDENLMRIDERQTTLDSSFMNTKTKSVAKRAFYFRKSSLHLVSDFD